MRSGQEHPTHSFFKVQYIIIQGILIENRKEKLQLPMKKFSMSIRLLTVKNNSHTDLRTSNAHLSQKSCQYGEEDYENKILS